jgi:hypothetical protein
MCPRVRLACLAQPLVLRELTDYARMVVGNSAAFVRRDGVVAFDGSWTHSRGGRLCVGIFIDCRTSKIVDFEFAELAYDPQTGQADCSPQAVEPAAFGQLASRWRTSPPRIAGIVHDQDAKVSKIIAVEDLRDCAETWTTFWTRTLLPSSPSKG